MRLGIFSINNGACADPTVGAAVAAAAEAAGMDSVWTGEHVVLPDPHQAPSPTPPMTPMLDPTVALAFIAAHTKTIKLATGITVLTQRNPLVMAKEFASLDVASNGRLIVGVGAGYLHQEFAALHAPFDRRGTRLENGMAAMRAIWEMEHPRHDGPFWNFSDVQARPRPVQARVPFVMGGRGGGAFSRSVRLCEGWYGFALDADATRACLRGLGTAAAEHERPAELGELEITITPPPIPLTPALVDEYRNLGVHRLVVLPRGTAGRDDLLRLIDESVQAVADAN
jgi:probable F420-dependent oxidoreductase